MKDKRDKKSARKRRKAEKKGEKLDKSDTELISMGFGGPEKFIDSYISSETEDFLDSTLFKKFEFSFGDPTQLDGQNLMTINFKTRRKVDHAKYRGKIYLDANNDAIAGYDFQGELVIPFIAKPILFAMGISITKPEFQRKFQMTFIYGKWYPDFQSIYVQLELEKKHLFSKNEISNFDIDQVFKINEIKLNNTKVIPKDYLFDSKKDLKSQVKNDSNWKWKDFNTLSLESH